METQTLAVHAEGKGIPVMLVHGIASTHRYWNAVVKHLPLNQIAVLRPDLLGFGSSPRPHQAGYTRDEQVAALAGCIQGLQLNSPFLIVGHSMGAIIALRYTIEQPKLVKQLILTSIPLFTPQTFYRQFASVLSPRFLKRHRLARIAVWTMAYGTFVPSKLVQTLGRPYDRHILDDIANNSPKVFRKIVKAAVFQDEVLDDLKKVTVPTKIIVGLRDGMVGEQGIKQLEEIAANNKKIQLEVWPSKHNIPLENPDKVAETIVSAIL